MALHRIFGHCTAAGFTVLLAVVAGGARLATGQTSDWSIVTPMSPPAWALLEGELLRANNAACREFFQKYFDERGFLLCVERWGGDDGPDDAMECCNDWPLLHALGGSDEMLAMYKRAWEGHLRQYTLARTSDVPMARDGMYYKEFPVSFDWLHNGEGLTVFNLQGLSDPSDRRFQQRVLRYAGFYMNEDPGAANYDPRHRLIRSLFNGSRGPLLRKATAVDWAGDPIEVENRFHLGHGEQNYQQMLDHFRDYNDIVGDHPQNLLATTLALNAFMLTGQQKYRDWLLEYVDAWVERMAANNDIIPSNIGLDGTIGGAADGKWYGGVYGWGFSVTVPQDGSTAHRNTTNKAFTGFMNAYLLTGNDRYLEPWRKQIAKVNAQVKLENGKRVYPKMFGDQGWYNYTPEPYLPHVLELYYLSCRDHDLQWQSRDPSGAAATVLRLDTDQPWLAFLRGNDPGYPERALRADLERLRLQVAGMRADASTPDTRLADDPMRFNPASAGSLVALMLGGIHPGNQGNVLQARLRYFDPQRRRAGLPEGVAALVHRLSADRTDVTLVNTDQTESRRVTIQAGGYAEHEFESVEIESGPQRVLRARDFTVQLEPGCGASLRLQMGRYRHPPTLQFPWDR
jgi:hypothetical protein